MTSFYTALRNTYAKEVAKRATVSLVSQDMLTCTGCECRSEMVKEKSVPANTAWAIQFFANRDIAEERGDPDKVRERALNELANAAVDSFSPRSVFSPCPRHKEMLDVMRTEQVRIERGLRDGSVPWPDFSECEE